jgi:hypothetical protein
MLLNLQVVFNSLKQETCPYKILEGTQAQGPPLKLSNKCTLRIIETRIILSGTETGYYSLREASTLTYSYGAMLV